MYAVEFQATVNDDGNIEIPAVYRSQLKGTLRVIILASDIEIGPSFIQQLLEQPRPATSAHPLTRDEIYDRSL